MESKWQCAGADPWRNVRGRMQLGFRVKDDSPKPRATIPSTLLQTWRILRALTTIPVLWPRNRSETSIRNTFRHKYFFFCVKKIKIFVFLYIIEILHFLNQCCCCLINDFWYLFISIELYLHVLHPFLILYN